MNLSVEQKDKLQKKVADLKIQAMMFDMDIDWETLSLTPKSTNEKPFWVQRWQDKLYEGDVKHEFGE